VKRAGASARTNEHDRVSAFLLLLYTSSIKQDNRIIYQFWNRCIPLVIYQI
jgi:hypothetical protein